MSTQTTIPGPGHPDYEALRAKVAELETRVTRKAAVTPTASAPVTGNPSMTAKFRKLADGMQNAIDNARRPMTQNPTPKRMCQYRSRLHDADNWARTQKALNALASAWETGTITLEQATLKTKDEVSKLVYKSTLGGGYYDVIPDPEYRDKSPLAVSVQQLIDRRVSSAEQAEGERLRKIALLEADVQFSNIPGFFPTPKPVISQMLERVSIEPFCSVLEPSAGCGDIADAVLALDIPDVEVYVCELNSKLREILDLKGHVVVAHDFMEYMHDMEVDGGYDRIVMNPPFERGQDAEHVRRAFTMLAPGGTLVAVMSEGSFFRSDRKATEFRDWLEAVGGESEKLPEGSFTGKDATRQTGVNCRIVTITA
jgi:hypothetical protein